MAETVALSMRIVDASGYHEPRDAISHDWLRRVAAWGMTPVLVPNILADVSAFLDAAHPRLLILTGGDDPGAPGERHATESRLIDYALLRALPILGVCRGLQVLNLRFGGRLTEIAGHVATMHEIAVDAPFRDAYGAHETVNSYHALGITPDGLAGALAPFARDASGAIEGAYHRAHPLVGLMWHPERAGAPAGDARLARSLVERGAFWA
jgi:gamma-glutamyl-gamma-aminobutyrate hydrolase PuuD